MYSRKTQKISVFIIQSRRQNNCECELGMATSSLSDTRVTGKRKKTFAVRMTDNVHYSVQPSVRMEKQLLLAVRDGNIYLSRFRHR